MPRRTEPSGANRRRKMLKRIETMASFKQSFSEFIFATNTDCSGKAASYVRALDMLGPILAKHCPIKVVNGSMWHSFSLADIHAVHEWMCAEMKKGTAVSVRAEIESRQNRANRAKCRTVGKTPENQGENEGQSRFVTANQ